MPPQTSHTHVRTSFDAHPFAPECVCVCIQWSPLIDTSYCRCAARFLLLLLSLPLLLLLRLPVWLPGRVLLMLTHVGEQRAHSKPKHRIGRRIGIYIYLQGSPRPLPPPHKNQTLSCVVSASMSPGAHQYCKWTGKWHRHQLKNLVNPLKLVGCLCKVRRCVRMFCELFVRARASLWQFIG